MKHPTVSRTPRRASSQALFGAFLLSAATFGHAQGITEYCNFESPQVKPITIAKLTSPNETVNTFLLVCNTPDNAIEVWDITGSLRDSPSYVDSIPVGLEPVSVVFKQIKIGSTTKDMLYSVNWLGDSVTFVELSLTDTPQFAYTITREVRVTDPLADQDTGGTIQRCDDEPMHLAVVDRPTIINPPIIQTGCGQFLVVTKRLASSYTMLHPFTGAIIAARNNSGSLPSGSGANVIMTSDGDEGDTQNGQIVFGQGLSASPDAILALKDPHTVLWRPGTDQFWVLGHKGGGALQTPGENEPVPFGFDFDLWGIEMPPSNLSSARNDYFIQTDLGTINFNMAFNASGSYLYVVGTRARDDVIGNGNLATDDDTETGFVQTMLYRMHMNTRVVESRDLNLDEGVPVDGPTQSLSHAVDVAVYEPSGGGTYVAVAAFNSSRLGLVAISGSSADDWAIKPIGVESEPSDPTQEDTTDPPQAAGPRGLAVLKTSTAADDRIYTLNRLDQTMTVFDPNGGTPLFVRQLSLQRPTVEPAHVSEGRKFLYSTKFSGDSTDAGLSGGQLEGFVSCASCHVDARSDNLRWKLTARAASAPHIKSVLSPPPDDGFDALEVAQPTTATATFPVDSEPPDLDANAKGPMVTQSLQGLSNSEVGGDWLEDEDENDPTVGDTLDDADENPFDDLVTNAPYHWRGDKENFRHFNEAFVNLQGADDQGSAAVPGGGLTTAEMKSYELFIHSIHYPPNPLQPKERSYSGDAWEDEDELDSDTDTASGAMRGLKLFHIQGFGDDGDSGRSCIHCHSFPEGSNNRVTCFAGPAAAKQPMESTALRGLFQKEARLALNAERIDPGDPTPLTGEFGFLHSGNRATQNDFLDGFDPDVGPLETVERRTRITEFMRQFDSGTAPIVGLSEMVTTSGSNAVIDDMEEQAAEANCGIAVFARVKNSGVFEHRGYWYKLTASGGAKYKRAGTTDELSQTSLTDLLDETGELMIFRATPLGSDRRIASFGMSSSDEPEETISTPSDIAIVGTTPNSANDPVVDLTANWDMTGTNLTLWTDPGGDEDYLPLTMRLAVRFQDAVGISPRRHDPSRRLQVTGTDLTYGAKIRLTFDNVDTGDGGALERQVELPIFPTSEFVGSDRIWETAVEFDALALYTMILGGPGDSAIETVFRDPDATATLTPQDVTIEASNITGGWSTPDVVPFEYEKVP